MYELGGASHTEHMCAIRCKYMKGKNFTFQFFRLPRTHTCAQHIHKYIHAENHELALMMFIIEI